MSSKSKQSLKVDNNQKFPNNNTGFITPDKLRSFNEDIIDSFVANDYTQSVDNTIADVSQSFNQFTSSYYTDSASVDGRLDSIEAETASLQSQIDNITFDSGSLVTTASFNDYTQSTDSRLDSIESTTASLQSQINDIDTGSLLETASVSLNTITFTKADASTFNITIDTGSVGVSEFNDILNNPFSQSVDRVVIDRHLIPSGSEIDLGSPENPFRELYLSSASLYIDNTKVLSSDATNLDITTSPGQSLRLIEEGVDSMTFQVENGDLVLTSTSTGVIELNAPIQISAGRQFLASDGNEIKFGDGLDISGNIIITGTVDGVDVSELETKVTGLSSQTGSYATTGSNTFTQTQTLEQDLVVQGNLYVSGAEIIISSSELIVGDRIIEINANKLIGDAGIYAYDAIGDQTGSFIWNPTLDYWLAGISGSEEKVLVSSDTASLETSVNAINGFTQSAEGRLDSLESATASLQSQIDTKLDSSSFNSYTQSTDLRLSSLETETGSLQSQIDTKLDTGSYLVDSASFDTRIDNISFDTSSLVTIDTQQTITARKNFEDIIYMDSDNQIQFGSFGTQTYINSTSRNLNLRALENDGKITLQAAASNLGSVYAGPEISLASNNVTGNGKISLTTNTLYVNSTNKNVITGSVDLQDTFTASLQEGYVWVGDSSGRTTTVATSSFGSEIDTGSFATTGSNNFVGNQDVDGIISSTQNQSNVIYNPQTITDNVTIPTGQNALIIGDTSISGDITIEGDSELFIYTQPPLGEYLTTASYLVDSASFDSRIDNISVTVDTGSLLETASVNLNTITFTKGDSSTFDITIDTGSAGGTTDTGSLLETASVSLNTITFTKGDSTTFDITVDTGSQVDITSLNSFTASADSRLSSLENETGSYATLGANTFTGNQVISGSSLNFDMATESDRAESPKINLYTSETTYGGTTNASIYINDDGKRTGFEVSNSSGESGSNVTGFLRLNDRKILAEAGGTIQVPDLPVTFGQQVNMFSNLQVEGAFDAGLTQGHVWVGNDTGGSTEISVGVLFEPTNQFTASADSRLSSLEAETGSYATTGANTFTDIQTISGSTSLNNELHIGSSVKITDQPDFITKFTPSTLEGIQQIVGNVQFSGSDFWQAQTNNSTYIGVNDSNQSYRIGFGTLFNSSNYTYEFASSSAEFNAPLEVNGDITTSGSVSITETMNLKQLDPLPAGAIGDLAVSSSNLYFHDGTDWKTVNLT